VYFAKEVLGHEDPFDWIVPRPDLTGLGDAVAADVRQRVRTISNLTRRMNWGLSFASLAPGHLRDQCASIQGHVEKGVADICAGRYGAAVWEFHLAVEISLKLFLAQCGVSPIPHTHDLPGLIQHALDHDLPSIGHIAVNVLPSHNDAIRHRYSEISEPSLHTTMEIYETALRLVGHVGHSLEHHELSLREAVYLKALPWHPSRKQVSNPQILR
jgi:HEPN domain-containing protein